MHSIEPEVAPPTPTPPTPAPPTPAPPTPASAPAHEASQDLPDRQPIDSENVSAPDEPATVDNTKQDDRKADAIPNRPAPQPRQPLPTAPSGPRPYFDPDGPTIHVRRVKRKKKNHRQEARPTTSEIINANDEVGIRVRTKPRWYRLIGRSGSMPGFEFEYTLGSAPILFGHMLLQAVCACVVIQQLPNAMQTGEFSEWGPVLGALMVSFVVATYTVSMLTQILAQSAKGVVDEINMDPVVGIKHMARWIVVAIAGPAFLMASTVWFWVNCGEISTLDWIVLGELVVATFAYFLVGGTTTLAIGRLSGVLPHSVLGTIFAMPMTVLWTTLLFLTGGGISAWLTKTGAESLHADGDGGYFLVALACILMGFVGLGLARWLGTAFFKHRMDTLVEQATKTIVPKDMTEFAEHAQQAGQATRQRIEK
jgi:hypothetical protein